MRQLVSMQNGRKKPYLPHSVGPYVGYVRRYPPAVTQTRHGTGRDTKNSVYHVHQIAYRLLQLMLAAQPAVMHQTFPQVAVIHRTLLERPFVTIRHDQNHRLATAVGYHVPKRICRPAFVLPRTLIAVDTVKQIQYRKRLSGFRYVYIHAPEDMFLVAIPERMNDLRRYFCRIR